MQILLRGELLGPGVSEQNPHDDTVILDNEVLLQVAGVAVGSPGQGLDEMRPVRQPGHGRLGQFNDRVVGAEVVGGAVSSQDAHADLQECVTALALVIARWDRLEGLLPDIELRGQTAEVGQGTAVGRLVQELQTLELGAQDVGDRREPQALVPAALA